MNEKTRRRILAKLRAAKELMDSSCDILDEDENTFDDYYDKYDTLAGLCNSLVDAINKFNN